MTWPNIEYRECDWAEDASHENGAYNNVCVHCNRVFIGHKRRVCCKVCDRPAPVEERGIDAPYPTRTLNPDDLRGRRVYVTAGPGAAAVLKELIARGVRAEIMEDPQPGMKTERLRLVDMPIIEPRQQKVRRIAQWKKR